MRLRCKRHRYKQRHSVRAGSVATLASCARRREWTAGGSWLPTDAGARATRDASLRGSGV